MDEANQEMLDLLARAENFEEVGNLLIRVLQQSIKAAESGYLDTMDALHDHYVAMLELSVESGQKLVDTSADGFYKQTRRQMYREHQQVIAKKTALIHEVEKIIAQRKGGS